MPDTLVRPRKGEATRAAILDTALRLASATGIEALTIGTLAEEAGMSKSGVFAHFGSREELQVAVVHEYHRRFQRDVFDPVMALPRGLPRLKGLFDQWIGVVTHEIQHGCIYISGAFEYDGRPGAVRDALMASISVWREALERACRQAVEAGHMRPETDPEQLVFELMGLVLALNFDARFLQRPDALARTVRALSHRIAEWQAPAWN
ncbi:TetR/AcrR family transcriptional regulator [Achromobacter sp. GG226]|uniref:TetR/AcrR family transcriptional regulator n=1 Tax=Verticiella alkaliphila TaxID=2779529 RepID=UPI001C0C31B6|nr:TetR/AcrR family transcriptional regulator [Verticiella sp. GG226]MBU4611996.1 TetR/AcrR family transcriptional regulator [Verticiella sp. GG226]